jgi:hypothetical protein
VDGRDKPGHDAGDSAITLDVRLERLTLARLSGTGFSVTFSDEAPMEGQAARCRR